VTLELDYGGPAFVGFDMGELTVHVGPPTADVTF
jgi:hypothetical protein